VGVTGLAGLAVVAVVLVAATCFGLWRRARDGRVSTVTDDASDRPLLAGLGVDPSAPVTLLQFSSAFCAPCRATRVTCARIAAEHDEVRHVEVDAESHLDAVRAHGVWRTPTVFVVAAGGRITARVTGQPTGDQLREAVVPLLHEEVRP
jgi:thiol-disulfide isomerase/thioredoxin